MKIKELVKKGLRFRKGIGPDVYDIKVCFCNEDECHYGGNCFACPHQQELEISPETREIIHAEIKNHLKCNVQGCNTTIKPHPKTGKLVCPVWHPFPDTQIH